MREIKFRAWDTQAEEILYGVEHTYDGYKVPMSSFGALLDCPDFYIVMQYTGLKDKNGKEYIGEVKSYEDAASFFVVAKEHYMECLDNVYDLEVIGNIHENKEH